MPLVETYIFVPKCLAQTARKFLSKENRFLNHKGFLTRSIDEKEESLLGLPIKASDLISGNNQEEICLDEVDKICVNDVQLCKRLALHLNISQGSVQLKKFYMAEDNILSNEYKSTIKVRHNRKKPQNALEKLKRAWLEAVNELGIDQKITESDNVPKHWEIHDDLILFPANSFQSINIGQNRSEDEKISVTKFHNAICKIFSIKRIAIKDTGGIQNDDFRSPSVILAYGFEHEGPTGDDSFCTWARRIENGIIQTWDITKCMFCVGNITEKLRVAGFDCEHEVVVDLFAGIGYFVLPYLIHAKAKHVYACEWNPASVRSLKRNLQLNKVPESKYTIYEGDNRVVCPKNIADRVNLGLIPSAEASYKTAVDALKNNSGGILHIHANVRRQKGSIANHNRKIENEVLSKQLIGLKGKENSDNSNIRVISSEHDNIVLYGRSSVCDTKFIEWQDWSYKTARLIGRFLAEKGQNCNWEITMLHLEHVKAFAPFVDHLVLDLQCKPL